MYIRPPLRTLCAQVRLIPGFLSGRKWEGLAAVHADGRGVFPKVLPWVLTPKMLVPVVKVKNS